MGFDFRKSILASKLSCLPKNLLWILTAFWKKSFWRWVLFLLWKLIKNNRKSAKIILIFFGVIETGSQNCIQISKGVLIGQTVCFLWPKIQEQRRFWWIYVVNEPNLPFSMWKLTLGIWAIKTKPFLRFLLRFRYIFASRFRWHQKIIFWQIFCYF